MAFSGKQLKEFIMQNRVHNKSARMLRYKPLIPKFQNVTKL